MRTVAFVPVKLNNQRFPGKNTKKFADGMPLLTYFLKTLVAVEGFDSIYVYCSNEEICKYIVEGVEFQKRPKELDLQTTTPQDIISCFIKENDADVYAVCHCTSPFVTAEHISECLRKVKNEEYDSAFLGERIQKLLWNKQCKAVNFTPDNIPRTQDLSPLYAEVPAAFIFKKEMFIKYRRRIGINPFMVEVDGIETVDIDYLEDFMIADAIYMNIINK